MYKQLTLLVWLYKKSAATTGICKVPKCEMVKVWKMIISYTIIWIIITYKGKVPVHTKKAYRGGEVYSHSFLTLAPD
jgi:hypothetical protein